MECTFKSKYRTEGFLSPLPALNPNEIKEAQDEYMNLCEPGYISLKGEERIYGHLLHPWIAKIVTHPKILSIVSQLIGESILVWISEFNSKAPNSLGYFSWHQDFYYWGYQYKKDWVDIPIVTVWLSIFETTQANGGMQFIPGSHTQLMTHREEKQKENMLSRGQVLQCPINEELAVPIDLKAGEFSVHHPLLYHASGPNKSSHSRVGLVIRYVSPRIPPPLRPAYAWLVGGEDKLKQWDHVAPIHYSNHLQARSLRTKSIDAVQAMTGALFK